jgi:ABC-type amino acid transport substrate-binding protein/mono/diheme cytochrome c family protein
MPRVLHYAVYAAAAALACAAATARAAESPPPLRLCADPANLPFSSQAAGDSAPGLYVEVGRAIARALGRPMETLWSQSYFGKRNLRDTMLSGRCDLAVGLPADPDFMGPSVIFTRPFLKIGYALVVPKGSSIRGVEALSGQRVAVQFATPPQSALATRGDVTLVTTLDPEDALQRLAAGSVNAAFVWGPNAGYANHAQFHDAYDVIPVDAPQMQWQAAVGVARRNPELRDRIDAALPDLQPVIRTLAAKYAVPTGDSAPPATTVPGALPSPVPAAAPAPAQPVLVAQAPAAAALPAQEKGDPAAGHEVFNGTCAHCHGPDAVVADRRINLRRLKEKYGDDMEQLFFTTVTNGRPAKGMPSWKDVFKHEDFVNIFAYLQSVQDK